MPYIYIDSRTILDEFTDGELRVELIERSSAACNMKRYRPMDEDEKYRLECVWRTGRVMDFLEEVKPYLERELGLHLPFLPHARHAR